LSQASSFQETNWISPKQGISVVIPVFNEKQALGDTFRRLLSIRKQLPPNAEVIFVNDASADGSGAVLEQFAKQFPDTFRVADHHRNLGYGASLKTGIESARHEWIAIADADGTYPIDLLVKLIREVDERRTDMLVGKRSQSGIPGIRKPAKAVLRRFAEYLCGQPIPDLNSGMRLFRRSDARRLKRVLPDGFSFTTTITMALMTEGKKVEYVPIAYRLRTGDSKIRPLRDTMTFSLLICRMAMTFNPLKVFGPVGLIMILFGGFLLMARMFLDDPFGVATTIIFLVGGVQLIGLGLLADLVNRRG